MTELLISGILMGIVATVAMDLWALLLSRTAGVPLPNWGAIGRWVAHIGRGKIFHDDIADATPVEGETAIGWAFHYGVGIGYGIGFLVIIGSDWLAAPSFLPAWIFAIATLAFGWFLLQPGIGIGWAAAKTPNPAKVRALGLAAHTVFGIGLWITALILA